MSGMSRKHVKLISAPFQREIPPLSPWACLRRAGSGMATLCNSGPDAVANLQWRTIADARAKARWGELSAGKRRPAKSLLVDAACETIDSRLRRRYANLSV